MESKTCEMEKAARMESPFALPNSHFFVGEISEQAALAAGNNTLRLIYLTKQKQKADNMDCISRGEREKGRFVAKGDLNFLAAEYFPTRHLGGGGLAFEVPAMSLGQLSERK
jgi:hypothetical protein